MGQRRRRPLEVPSNLALASVSLLHAYTTGTLKKSRGYPRVIALAGRMEAAAAGAGGRGAIGAGVHCGQAKAGMSCPVIHVRVAMCPQFPPMRALGLGPERRVH